MDDGPVSVIALLGFLGVVIIVLNLMHYYIWRRLVRATTLPGSRSRRIGTWLVVAVMLSTVFAQVGTFLLPPEVTLPLAWLGYGWLGFAFYLVLFLLVGEFVRLGIRLFARRSEPAPAAVVTPEPVPAGLGPGTTPWHNPPLEEAPDPTSDVSRRLFLSRSIAVGAGVAAASVGGYGIVRAMADPIVQTVTVQIAGLDPRLGGFRIALFSDAHLGSIRRKAAMERLVDIVNGTESDLVAVVGDLIDGSVADLGDDVAPMANLSAPQGTFFVTGNHEYYSGVEDWVEYLPDLGVRVLANERLAIERDGAAFDLAGINDITGADMGDGPDFEAALSGRRRDRPVVLLAHQPVTVDNAVEFGVDLQLSGHTHGGQLWPFHYVIALQQGVVSGLSRIEDTQLYVTSGAGFWGPPMRVGADPEVVVIELHPEQ